MPAASETLECIWESGKSLFLLIESAALKKRTRANKSKPARAQNVCYQCYEPVRSLHRNDSPIVGKRHLQIFYGNVGGMEAIDPDLGDKLGHNFGDFRQMWQLRRQNEGPQKFFNFLAISIRNGDIQNSLDDSM
ncbi:hypothetical protein AVEN_200637-1 [Araneus ventricosus]|uniref:Uncharacterized protein n=1 Tax=Araneus ventricosus TaxID=182803 RepID=A0A4Y2I2P0_ARAVE|nr:hypothetical protein AVEN_200637-1 [Araneus ventricosus]